MIAVDCLSYHLAQISENSDLSLQKIMKRSAKDLLLVLMQEFSDMQELSYFSLVFKFIETFSSELQNVEPSVLSMVLTAIKGKVDEELRLVTDSAQLGDSSLIEKILDIFCSVFSLKSVFSTPELRTLSEELLEFFFRSFALISRTDNTYIDIIVDLLRKHFNACKCRSNVLIKPLAILIRCTLSHHGTL